MVNADVPPFGPFSAEPETEAERRRVHLALFAIAANMVAVFGLAIVLSRIAAGVCP